MIFSCNNTTPNPLWIICESIISAEKFSGDFSFSERSVCVASVDLVLQGDGHKKLNPLHMCSANNSVLYMDTYQMRNNWQTNRKPVQDLKSENPHLEQTIHNTK